MKYVIALAATVQLLGCATPYQASGFRGGFTETQLDENVFKVSFEGNAYVSAKRVADYTLLRSAEVALQHGFQHFIIVDATAHESRGVNVTPGATYTTVSQSGGSIVGTSTTYQPIYSTYSKPSSSNTIVCFQDKPDGLSYDARLIAQTLRHQLRLD